MESEWRNSFLEKFRIEDVAADDYEKISNSLNLYEAFMRPFYQRAVIIDYHKMNFMCVSSMDFTLCEMPSTIVKNRGLAFLVSQIPCAEWADMERKILVVRHRLDDMPMDERGKCMYSFSFPFINGKYKMRSGAVCVPLAFSKSGKPWIVSVVFFLAPSLNCPEIVFRNDAKGILETFDNRKQEWVTEKIPLLSELEKWIIAYSGQGIPTKTICNLLDMSYDAIKLHRKLLFRKLQVSTMPEAIICAELYRLL